MSRQQLDDTFRAWFAPEQFRDAAENGLQVEGKDHVERVVCGVSANRALLEQAVEHGADAVFVHHGIVWGGGMRKLSGWLKERVALLLKHDINLFAFHLPLDAHPELGNNAGLSDAIGLRAEREPFGEYKGQFIGTQAPLESPMSLQSLVGHVSTTVGTPVAVFGDDEKTIRTVGVCSGGAPDLLHEAVDRRLDAFVTGEVTEWVKAVAEETNTAFLALGHHNTERFGARRVAARLSQEGLEATFVDVENPA